MDKERNKLILELRAMLLTFHLVLSFHNALIVWAILNSFHKDQYFMLDRIQMILPSKITR